jgi:hypothetical protein
LAVKARPFTFMKISKSLVLLCTLVSALASSVTLQWDQNLETNIVQYKIYRSVNGGGYISSPVNWPLHQITYSDIGVGNSYSFFATAVNTEFLESLSSSVVPFTPPPPLPALNVTKVTPFGISGSTWTGVQVFFNTVDLTVYQAASYSITALAAGGGTTTITSTNSPAVFPTLAVKGYTFSVSASNSNGTSPAGTTGSLSGTAPTVVANVKVQIGP